MTRKGFFGAIASAFAARSTVTDAPIKSVNKTQIVGGTINAITLDKISGVYYPQIGSGFLAVQVLGKDCKIPFYG